MASVGVTKPGRSALFLVLSVAVALVAVVPASVVEAKSKAVKVHEDYFTVSDGVKIHYYTLGKKGPWFTVFSAPNASMLQLGRKGIDDYEYGRNY